MLAVGLGVLAIVALGLWLDDGEILTLETTDPSGQVFETELWVVELQGVLYVRGVRGSRWVQRVRTHPEVTVVRGGDERIYHARSSHDPDTVARVDAAMASKYGYADGLFGRLFEEGSRIVIRLSPGIAASTSPQRAEVSPSRQ
jgi:hypothetical protein